MSAALPDWLRPLVAHRGLHSRSVPENSSAACRAAASMGYGIEIDIQLSSDGEAMVFHDETLDRLTDGAGLVSERSAAALTRLHLLETEETIPTFAEVLEAIGGAAPLLVEIKDASGRYEGTDGRCEARVAALLADYDGPAAVMSFNPATPLWFRDNAPERPRGLVSFDFEDEPSVPADRRKALATLADLDRVGASFVAYGWRGLGAPAVQAARARGLPVMAWTIRSAGEAALAKPDCDGLIFEDFLPDPAGSTRDP